MAQYYPLLGIAILLAVVIAMLAWPWLRRKQTRERAIVISFVGFCLALAIYLSVGSPFAVQQIAARQEYNQALLARIETLNTRLSANDMQIPNAERAAGWAELGASYMELEQYAPAADALRQAVLASGGEPHVILLYGKAQMLAADGAVTEGAEQAFMMAARQMPDNPEPLFLLAVGKMQQGDKEGARAVFEELLPRLPEGAPLRQRLLERLQKME